MKKNSKLPASCISACAKAKVVDPKPHCRVDDTWVNEPDNSLRSRRRRANDRDVAVLTAWLYIKCVVLVGGDASGRAWLFAQLVKMFSKSQETHNRRVCVCVCFLCEYVWVMSCNCWVTLRGNRFHIATKNVLQVYYKLCAVLSDDNMYTHFPTNASSKY